MRPLPVIEEELHPEGVRRTAYFAPVIGPTSGNPPAMRRLPPVEKYGHGGTPQMRRIPVPTPAHQNGK
jgi:hypothetical protein